MDLEATLAYSVFVFTKGRILPSDFVKMDESEQAAITAFLKQYAKDTEIKK